MRRALLPGLLLVAGATVLSLALSRALPAVSALVVAIVVGVVVRNTGWLRPAAAAGVAWWGKKLLRVGVVLLGLQLSLAGVLALGGGGLLVIAGTVVVTFAATVLLGRALRVPPTLTLLVATGFSICGAAAVAAMSAVVDPDGEHDEDTATAVALVTLYGSVALVTLPLLVPVLGLDARSAGLWIGASIHEVAQVVAAGGAVSAAALAVATVTKLGRVVLLAPVVAAAGALRRGAGRGKGARPPVVPLFVGGFLGAVALRSTGAVPDPVLAVATVVTTALLTGAMFALGTGVDLRRLARTGGRAAALGGASTVVAAGVAGALVVLVA